MYQVGSPNRKVRISPTAIIKLDNGQNLVWPRSDKTRTTKIDEPKLSVISSVWCKNLIIETFLGGAKIKRVTN